MLLKLCYIISQLSTIQIKLMSVYFLAYTINMIFNILYVFKIHQEKNKLIIDNIKTVSVSLRVCLMYIHVVQFV